MNAAVPADVPDVELATAAIGSTPRGWARLDGGYTQSRAWRIETNDGPFFLKEALGNPGALTMLRREALVYANVRGPFLPAFVGVADRGDRAALAIEYVSDALWPPPYPDDVTPLFAALEAVAGSAPPGDLPAHGRRTPHWEQVGAEPKPFLELGLCSSGWLETAIDALVAAEREATFEGTELVHNDVYSGNVCFAGRRALLVDWGAAVRGSSSIDLAFAALSLRVEGATAGLHFPGEAAFAAALAGHFAVEVPGPLPAWTGPDSTLREDMLGDLRHALDWAVELLALRPLR